MSRRRVDAGEQARIARAKLAQMGPPMGLPVAPGHGRAAPVAAAPDPDPGLGPAEALRLGALGWLDSKPPPVRWLLQDVLAWGEVGMVAAPGATGKTWLLLQMAIGVASGTGICDFGMAGALWHPTVPTKVLVLTAEETSADLHRRIWTIVQSLSLSVECLAWLQQNFHIASLRGQENLLNVREPGSLKWRSTDQAKKILSLVNQIKDLGLIIIEPVSRFRAGEENDAAAASALVAWFEQLSMLSGATVLTASHVAKWARADSELSQDSIRGSSALVDGVRWGAVMRRMQQTEADKLGLTAQDRRGKIQIAIPKANNSTGHKNAWLEQMSNGVLRLLDLKAEKGARSPAEIEYDRVVGAVCDFLISHPGEKWTVGGLEKQHAGAAGVFGVGQKTLRAILGRAVEEGRIKTTEGRGQGYLMVGGKLA